MSGGAEALRSLAREPHATHIRSFIAIVALLRIAVLSPLTLLEAHLASIIDAERLRLWAFGEDDPKIGQGYVNAVLGDKPLDVVPAAPSARLAENRQRRDAHVSEGQAVAGYRLMDRPLIPVERRNEVGAHQGALTVLRMVAIGAWHAGEIAVNINRKNRILGNPFILRDANDKAARADVIERFAVKYHADLACDGPMSAATQALAERVKTGERIVCMCW
jgi:hypothetical protein